MSCSLPSCCTKKNISSFANGSGRLTLAAAGSAALLTVMLAVAAIAIGLLVSDGLFLYSVGAEAPLSLIWAIPCTLIFVVVDLIIIAQVGQAGATMSHGLINCIKTQRRKYATALPINSVIVD